MQRLKGHVNTIRIIKIHGTVANLSDCISKLVFLLFAHLYKFDIQDQIKTKACNFEGNFKLKTM